MSRPATRNKNKRLRSSNDADHTSETLRKIYATQEITDEDIRSLYMTWKPVCQGCRVNTKDNPNCFCGLVPPPNGSRKSGLWQKMSDIVQALGPDPSKDLRPSTCTPAGLTNLGATCYANSILQCLYMNKSFREGLFSVEIDVLKKHPVLDQLARLCAQLHASRMAFIDSAPFIKTLELDNGVQQDSHEFLTLLLSLLERCFSHSTVPKTRLIVQDLFRGTVSHVTTCSRCGRDSEASSKMEDFYELELNVKGLKGLDESLDDYLSLEELSGDNQYVCASCNTRVDATRCIKLRKLPAVLNFQLKRCIFLPKTTTKKKITSVFSFPRVLDMTKRLSDPSQTELIYELSAVLMHKGTAVNSGHYIAHIKDERTGQWWEFDDEHVTNLGHHPFAGASSSPVSKDFQTEPVASSSFSEKDDAVISGNAVDLTLPNHSSIQTEMFSSTDAYMLMYNLKRPGKENQERHTANPSSNVEMDIDCLPSYLSQDIEIINASYIEACEKFNTRKDRELKDISERRQEVRSILAEAAVRSPEESFYWIYSDWLRQWADSIMPPVLDNTPIMCIHKKVPVSKVNSIKRLSAQAWTRLASKYKGGPELERGDCCRECLMEAAKNLTNADSYRDRRTLMKDIATDVLSGRRQDGEYCVSKPWLQQWVKRKILDAPTEADAGPTNAIRCPHGQLMPEQAPGAKRVLIPEKFWFFLCEDAITVKPDDTLGSSAFHSDSNECPQCRDDLSEVACVEDSLRALKLKQRQNHEKLALGKSIPLSLECKYFLLPSQWLTKWRSYITASGKGTAAEPGILDSAIDSLKCKKGLGREVACHGHSMTKDTVTLALKNHTLLYQHLRLQERLPDLVHRRGSIFQKSPTADRLIIAPEHDWKCFCEEWSGTLEKGISATIQIHGNPENKPSVSSEKMSVGEGDPQEISNEIHTQRFTIKSCPQVCEECVGERESCELMQKLSYYNEDIYVFLVRGKAAPKSMLEAADSMTEPDRRSSKRPRRTNYGNLINLKVSAATSVYQLKMMIWESLGVVKENQILHKGTRIIDQESATLADMNIFPGDKLWVKDSEIHEHRDIADEICDKKLDVQHVEEGFRGTLLTADIPSQTIQEV